MMNRANALRRLAAMARQSRVTTRHCSSSSTTDRPRCGGLPGEPGNCLNGLHRYAEAVADTDRALPELRTRGRPADVARCQVDRAIGLNGLGHHAAAVAFYDEALPCPRPRSAHRRGTLPDEPGPGLDGLHDYAKAVAGYEDALGAFRAQNLPGPR
jgi:hypothetical protein